MEVEQLNIDVPVRHTAAAQLVAVKNERSRRVGHDVRFVIVVLHRCSDSFLMIASKDSARFGLILAALLQRQYCVKQWQNKLLKNLY